MLSNVVYTWCCSYHFDVQEVFAESGQCNRVSYTHVLSKGKMKQKHYGMSYHCLLSKHDYKHYGRTFHCCPRTHEKCRVLRISIRLGVVADNIMYQITSVSSVSVVVVSTPPLPIVAVCHCCLSLLPHLHCTLCRAAAGRDVDSASRGSPRRKTIGRTDFCTERGDVDHILSS